MTTLTRRKAMTALAVVPAAAAIGALPEPAAATLEDRVREFAHKLLSDPPLYVTHGTFVETKRIARVMLAMIGDEPPAWEEYELATVESMRQQEKRLAQILNRGSRA